MVDPRTPVVIGVAQAVHRDGIEGAVEAVQLMTDVVEGAFADAGAPSLASSTSAETPLRLIARRMAMRSTESSSMTRMRSVSSMW